MKWILTLVMIGTFSVSFGDSGFYLPDFCEDKMDDVYADPLSREWFYVCQAGQAYHFQCPAGLVFDESCKCCNWPDNPTIGNYGEQIPCRCPNGETSFKIPCIKGNSTEGNCTRDTPCQC